MTERDGEQVAFPRLSDAQVAALAEVGTPPLLRNPSTRELAQIIGLKPPLGNQVYDLVVVGAGPAGLAAAVYASSEGLSTVVLDDAGPGGQAGASSKIENYLGFPTGISGAELTGRATLQAATGADYRRLDVPERERFDGLGIYYAATQTELVTCRGSDVVVVGGGNSAGQAAMFLSEHTRRVLLLLRGGDVRKSMSSYLADRIEGTEHLEVLFHTEIRRMMGAPRLEAIEIENTEAGEVRTVATRGAVHPCVSGEAVATRYLHAVHHAGDPGRGVGPAHAGA